MLRLVRLGLLPVLLALCLRWDLLVRYYLCFHLHPWVLLGL